MTRDGWVSSAVAAAVVAGCGARDSGSACAMDGSELTQTLPDAALSDAGATGPACRQCLRASCSSEVAACGADCSCHTAFTEAFDCYARTGVVNAPGCGPAFGSLGGAGMAALDDVFTCIFKRCEPECIGAGVFASLPDGSSLDP